MVESFGAKNILPETILDQITDHQTVHGLPAFGHHSQSHRLTDFADLNLSASLVQQQTLGNGHLSRPGYRTYRTVRPGMAFDRLMATVGDHGIVEIHDLLGVSLHS